MRAGVIALVVLAPLFLAVVGADGPVFSASEAAPGGYLLALAAEEASLHIEVTNLDRAVTAWIDVFSLEFDNRGTRVASWFPEGWSVDASLAGIERRVELDPGDKRTVSVTLDVVDGVCAATCHVVMWSAGDVADVRYEATSTDASAGVVVLADHLETFMIEARDIEAETYLEIAGLGYDPVIQRSGRFPFTIHGRGIGEIGPHDDIPKPESVTLVGPDATTVCWCPIPEPLAPGDYEIRRDAVGVEGFPWFAVMADVPLPDA